jgi:hypothetical protein
MSDREPVAQAVNSIIRVTNDIARMLANPATYDEVAAEEAALWTIKNNVEWLLSYIDEKQKAQSKIRVVK